MIIKTVSWNISHAVVKVFQISQPTVVLRMLGSIPGHSRTLDSSPPTIRHCSRMLPVGCRAGHNQLSLSERVGLTWSAGSWRRSGFLRCQWSSLGFSGCPALWAGSLELQSDLNCLGSWRGRGTRKKETLDWPLLNLSSVQINSWLWGKRTRLALIWVRHGCSITLYVWMFFLHRNNFPFAVSASKGSRDKNGIFCHSLLILKPYNPLLGIFGCGTPEEFGCRVSEQLSF